MVSYRNGFINNHYMKDFHELLRLRRSTRKFTEQEIASDDVKTIMEAALMAPSSKRSLSWEFVLVEDAEKLERLSVCKDNGAKLIAGAKLAVVVLGDPMKSDVWIEDASIAATLIQLQAEENWDWVAAGCRYAAVMVKTANRPKISYGNY